MGSPWVVGVVGARGMVGSNQVAAAPGFLQITEEKWSTMIESTVRKSVEAPVCASGRRLPHPIPNAEYLPFLIIIKASSVCKPEGGGGRIRAGGAPCGSGCDALFRSHPSAFLSLAISLSFPCVQLPSNACGNDDSPCLSLSLFLFSLSFSPALTSLSSPGSHRA